MSVSRRCLCCVKYLMFVFNLIFWLGGCGLFGVGVWLSFTQAAFSSLPLSFPSLSAANLLLVAGGITMVTGFLGCLGALKEQRCLLFMFFVILLLLVLTEVTLVLVIHIFHDKLDSKAQNELKEGMKIYNSEPGLKKSWDNVQKMFKCCGVTDKEDWHDVLNGTLPSSCCSVGTDQCVDGWSEHEEKPHRALSCNDGAARATASYSRSIFYFVFLVFLVCLNYFFIFLCLLHSPTLQPCYRKARQWLLDNIPSVLVFGVCIGVVQILALVFSMLMYCQILCAEKDLD